MCSIACARSAAIYGRGWRACLCLRRCVAHGQGVEAALVEIVAQHGGHTPAAAAKFVADLKAQGRYQADVY
jgi:hypothetical protein